MDEDINILFTLCLFCFCLFYQSSTGYIAPEVHLKVQLYSDLQLYETFGKTVKCWSHSVALYKM